MLDYGFNQYKNKTLINKGTIIKQIKIDKANKNKINLILKEDLNITIPKDQKNKKYTYNIKLNKITYPIKKGQTIGKLYLKTSNKIITEKDLISNETITKANIFKQYTRVLKNFLTGTIN